jgi:hypothetical protein
VDALFHGVFVFARTLLMRTRSSSPQLPSYGRKRTQEELGRIVAGITKLRTLGGLTRAGCSLLDEIEGALSPSSGRNTGARLAQMAPSRANAPVRQLFPP